MKSKQDPRRPTATNQITKGRSISSYSSTMNASTALNQLALSIEASTIITGLDLYRSGLALDGAKRRASGTKHGSSASAKARAANLSSRFEEMMAALPVTTVRSALQTVNEAFVRVVGTDDGPAVKHRVVETSDIEAVQSLCGIYAHSGVACRLGFENKLLSALAVLYDRSSYCDIAHEPSKVRDLRESIFLVLSSLLFNGLVQSEYKSNGDDDDLLLQRMMEAVRMLSDASNCCLGDLQQWLERDRQSLVDAVQSSLPANEERDYLILMIQSSLTSTMVAKEQKEHGMSSGEHVPSFATGISGSQSTVSATDRLIAQVRDVLPNLGEGYVEAALAFYGFDAPLTLSALLEAESEPSALHPRLRALDTYLPARKKESSSVYDVNDDLEAKELQRKHMQKMEKQAEMAEYTYELVERVDMYNDDYDDQYDGVSNNASAADMGTYDIDIDAIREYNRIRKEEEKESAFWETSRNLNRNRKSGGKSGSEGEGEEGKIYRGPDKGKGGRLIGPDGKYLPTKKGGKKGKKQAVAAAAQPKSGNGGNANSKGDSSEMSKLQKRRKDMNKAKVGNHHRKERAAKKTSM